MILTVRQRVLRDQCLCGIRRNGILCVLYERDTVIIKNAELVFFSARKEKRNAAEHKKGGKKYSQCFHKTPLKFLELQSATYIHSNYSIF